MADPYDILGIGRSASEQEVKSAYRKLAKELHPDRNKDNPNAAERFSDITKAYDLLSDKEQRARYDRGEIDLEGNPTNPFAGAGAGAGAAAGARAPEPRVWACAAWYAVRLLRGNRGVRSRSTFAQSGALATSENTGVFTLN